MDEPRNPPPRAPFGWSSLMKRWLASEHRAEEPAIRWTAEIHDGERTSRVCLDTIAAVGIENLGQIAEHRIVPLVDGRVHLLRFVRGGELRYVCDRWGQVTELSARGLRGAWQPGLADEAARPPMGSRARGPLEAPLAGALNASSGASSNGPHLVFAEPTGEVSNR